MNLRHHLTKPPNSFAWEIGRKAAIRWVVVKHSVVAVLFWAFAIYAGAWLTHFGFGWVSSVLFLVWVYFALPSIIVQGQLIVDLLSSVFVGRMYFFPLMLELVESGEAERLRKESFSDSARAFFRFTEPLFSLASNTVPTVGVALWCIVTLVRTPLPARAAAPIEPQPISKEEIDRAVQLAHDMETAAAEEFTAKQFVLVG